MPPWARSSRTSFVFSSNTTVSETRDFPGLMVTAACAAGALLFAARLEPCRSGPRRRPSGALAGARRPRAPAKAPEERGLLTAACAAGRGPSETPQLSDTGVLAAEWLMHL